MAIPKEDYINYRLEKARKTLEDAKILANSQSWNSSVNRLYYACFYAVIAVLSKYEIESHTHMGAKSQFSLHFIKTGLIDKDSGLLFSDLFDLRHKGDYADFIEFEQSLVNTLIPKVEIFLNQIESLVKKSI
jgi:uncharacterized protein (UPF0332 family)